MSVLVVWDIGDKTREIEVKVSLMRGSKKFLKKVVILLQLLSIYLPTPIGVQKATFLIFFGYFEMMFKPLLEIEFFL